MDTFLQLTVSGVALGSIYGLVALGFLVVYHATGLVNFATGQILMVGAVSTFLLMDAALPFPVVVVGVIVVGLLVTVVFRFGIHLPMARAGAPLFSMVVATVAFGLVLTAVAGILVGQSPQGVAPIVDADPIRFGAVSITWQQLIITLVAWLLVLAIWIFFTKTLTGISLRAVGINRNAAAVSGVRVSRMITIGFAISVIVTVLCGMLISPIVGAGAAMGLTLAVKGFAAATIGGFSSVYTGMIAGVALGLLEQYVGYYISTQWAPLVAYIALFLALVLMPARIRQAVHA